MFDNLSERLGGILDRLTRRGALTEADVDAAMREVRRALLEADVSLDVVRSFTEKVREQAIGATVVKSVTPGQMVVKIVHDELVATLGSDFATEWAEERRVDQVVLEHGTASNDELYHALKPLSWNGGAVDYEALAKGGTIFPSRNPDGGFMLVRIGDAVASRNIHAAIYDGIRYALRF